MTLEEAIKHCKEKTEELNDQACTNLEMTEKEASDCLECATEHLQLATWLEELQEWRKLRAVCGFDGYTVYLCKDEQTKAESPQGDLISREALKKEVESLVVGGAEGLKNYYKKGSRADQNAWIGGVYDAWELIDNAPTVKLTETEIQEVLNKRDMTAVTNDYLIALHGARPQGNNKEALFVLNHLFYDCDKMTPNEYDVLLKAIKKGGAE